MRKKIIWLCSWYPNDGDRYTGDFIQRQAEAASMYADIEVVHVAASKEDSKVVHQANSYLRETIYYSKSSSKLFQYKDFFQLHESFISDYLRRKGSPDLIHVHIPIRSGLVALRWKKNYGWPFVLTEHYGIYNSHVKDRLEKRNYFFRFFTRKILKQADYFFPVSDFLGQCVQQHVFKKEYNSIPNVVNTSLFNFKTKDRHAKFRFIHVSDGSEIKNLHGILKAVEKLYKLRNDFELYCIGITNPRYTKWLDARSWSKSVVFVLPTMSYAQVAHQVQLADAGVLFSQEETQSCVVLEWLCAGKPVVSARAGGVAELINKDNGILVEEGHIDELAVAMSKMIDSRDYYNNESIASDAYSRYSFESVGKLLNEFYLRY